MKRLVLGLAVAVLLGGCTNTRISRSFSSGQIGCPPDEITITNETATGPMGRLHNWEAECRGKHYICSYEQTAGAHCKEALPEPTQNDSSASGS